MGPNAVKRHFRQYLNDNNMEIPVPKMGKRCTQGDINKVIGYIVDDKMSIKAASEKVNMSLSTGYKYYRQYLKEHSVDSSIRKRITQDQINEFIGYIKDNKMNVKAASRKANLAYTTSHRHYHRYLKAQKRDTPAQCPRVVSARKNK
jgi:hypothetical protein